MRTNSQKYAFSVFFLLIACRSLALPTEGFEAYTLLEDRKPTRPIYAQFGYVNPSWLSDYESAQVYTSRPLFKDDYVSFGFQMTAGNRLADRDAYFLRWDQTFAGQSVSLKLAHVDLRYIKAGKNTVSLDYNTAFGLGKNVRLYLTGGMHYRFTLNSWNTPTWSPANFNTEDREYYFDLCLGTRIPMGAHSFVTFDVNNRDPFTTYNGDDLAFDISLNLISAKNLIFRVFQGVRFSGLLAGTGDVGEETFMLGIISAI